MKIIREVCDRCGDELKFPRLVTRKIYTLEFFGGQFEYNHDKHDLCSTCCKEFEKFMSEVSNGKKDTKTAQI